MQPVVMAPKNLSTKHYGLNKIKEKDNRAEENTREKQKKDPREHDLYSNKESGGCRSAEPRRSSLRGGSGGRGRGSTSLRGVKPGGRQ